MGRAVVTTPYRRWTISLTERAGVWSGTTTTPDGEVVRDVPVTAVSPIRVVEEAKRLIDLRIAREEQR